MSDKIVRCPEQLFRAADANSYCQKLAGHKPPCQFNGVEVGASAAPSPAPPVEPPKAPAVPS